MTNSFVLFRFLDNYRNDNGGINLYPQFDEDLETLLDLLIEDFNDGTLDEDIE